MATRKLEVVITGDSRQLEKALGRADTASKQTESHFKSLGGASKLAGVAIAAGIGEALNKSVRAALDAQAAQANMVRQLKDAGFQYKAHAKQINESLDAESRLSTFTKEELQKQFSSLARTTGSVTKGLKDTALATDLARGKGISLDAATKIVTAAELGRVTSLTRMGLAATKVTTNTDALKMKLLTLSASHKTLSGAEKVHVAILKDEAKAADKAATAQGAVSMLQQKFAGASAAYSKTAAGAMDRVGVSVHELEVKIGTGLLPAIAAGSEQLIKFVDWVGANTPRIEADLKRFFGGEKTIAQVRQSYQQLTAAVQQALSVIEAAWGHAGSTITTIVRTLATMLMTVNAKMMQVIADLIKVVLDVITLHWGRAWDAMKDAVGATFDMIKAILKGNVTIFKTAAVALGTALYNGVKAPLAGIVDWTERTFAQVLKVILSVLDKIPSSIAGIGTGVGGIKTSLESWIYEFGKAGQSGGQAFASGLTVAVARGMATAMQIVQQTVATIQSTMAQVAGVQINSAAGGAVGTINRILAMGAVTAPTALMSQIGGLTGASKSPSGGGGSGSMGKVGLTLSGLSAEQRANAILIYRDVLAADGTPQEAMEMIAGSWMESGGLHEGAVNPKSGAFGLFQLLSSGYVNAYHSNIGKGMSPSEANIQAILPNYMAYFRSHPNFQHGAAASAVEASGESASWYAAGYGHGIGLGPGGMSSFSTAKSGKPGTAGPPPLVPQGLINKASRFASLASSRDNTGSLAQSYLESEYGALYQSEQIVNNTIPLLKGKARDAAGKTLTSIDNKMRDVLKQINDSMVVVGDALLPAGLRSKMTELTQKLKSMSASASVLTGAAADQAAAAILGNMQDQAAVLRDDAAALKVKLEHSTGKQRAAVQDELTKIKARLSDVNDQVLQALEGAVQTDQASVSSIFATIKGKMDAQFEAITQRMVDALGVQFFQGGALTPAEKALKAFQDAAQQKSLQDALTNATTPAERQAAEDAIEQDRLQTAATASRTAADKAYADATAKLQADRATLEQKMNDSLDAMLTAVLNGTGTFGDLQAIAAEYGVTITQDAIPEMGDLANATSTLVDAFAALAAMIYRITGVSNWSVGTNNRSGPPGYTEPSTPAWTDPGWWHPGLATGQPGTPAAWMVKRRPGGTLVRLGEGAHDEIVSATGARGGGNTYHVTLQTTVPPADARKWIRDNAPKIARELDLIVSGGR